MSWQKDHAKTIVEELEEASEELDELSKFYAKKKGRESYWKPVAGAATVSWRKPKKHPTKKSPKEENRIPKTNADHDIDDEYYHESFMDKDTFELVNMISMLNREPNLLPGGGPNNTSQSIQTQTYHHHDPHENTTDSDPKLPMDPCRCIDCHPPLEEDSVECLGSSDILDNVNYAEHGYPEPTELHWQQNESESLMKMNGNMELFPQTEGDNMNFPRMFQSIPSRGGTKKLGKVGKTPGYRGAVPINGDGQYEKYRSMNMNSYSGRDRIFKSPNSIGPSSPMSHERYSYQINTTPLPFHSESPPKEKTRPEYSPSHLTSILTGTDGKLMTGPNAVARLREHQQTSSKLFRPVRTETGPTQWRNQRTQLTVQNLNPSSTAGNANAQLVSDNFDSLNSTPSAPNLLLRSPKQYQYSVRNKDLSSRSKGHGMCKTPSPSLETFTVGVVKRPQKVQTPKSVSGISQTGNQAGMKSISSIRKSSTRTGESSGRGSFGKLSITSIIERKNSIGSNRSGSGKKREGKLKSPRVKKSNDSTKTEPEAINFFDNEKFNSLLMKMMAETDTTGDDGPNRIMTKKLKMPKTPKPKI